MDVILQLLLNLTVAPQLNVSIQGSGSATVCSGSTVTLNMATYASAVIHYQWNDANGIISGADFFIHILQLLQVLIV